MRKEYTVKLSAPNLYDMFSAQDNYNNGHTSHSYWLLNSSKAVRSGAIISDIGVPITSDILRSNRFGVRLVGYIKDSAVVTNGDGTYSSPYAIK